ncbi:YSC84-related protein [Algoriphagus persicinus]|uniref:YSC84-related protein n=1 Tax=Algoriphagus persicinus TaxID=3108754 RepID=UPI002B3D4B93|nr:MULTISPECIES: YSC84-related protein [unclassified Algoriphagus]MEB2782752.1 YSC84-related protein [Algoriphagus sp. C2-6-M1]MEB2785792.1 YSC84-related protein [Algoriphagus sp. E1-3-M2]
MMQKVILTFFFGLFTIVGFAQDARKDQRIEEDAIDAKAAFLADDPDMDDFFSSSYGYIILPNVGKGGLGIGGAAGNGVAYQGGSKVGYAKMTQITIGFQAGGQAYSEVVFFENKEAFDRFKNSKVEMSAQVSAVAAASGASLNAKYVEGVAVFTRTKGGLMYEASVGGQQFKFREN